MGEWSTSEAPRVETVTVGVKKDRQVEIAWFPKVKTIVDDANGTRNVRYFERAAAVVAGRWFAVGFYDLTTLAWDGAAWTHLVDPAQAEKDFPKGERVDAVATDGTRAWAVTTGGAVFTWNGSAWETTAESGGELFAKGRRFARLAYDRASERLVLWGGMNGTRWSNDTLLFQSGAWRKSRKPGTKLAARKADNFWVYDDTARGGIVRVGAEGVHVLDGDAWKPLELAAPAFVPSDPEASHVQLVIAHDPATKQTLWLDPLTGDLYREGTTQPISNVGLAPGLVTQRVLTDAGAYFWNDFERVNEQNWMWTWDPIARRVYGMRLESSKFVVSLDLGEHFAS